jgi:L-alanine-DL-glutamate epimerase-like enolase superfamily enzyme
VPLIKNAKLNFEREQLISPFGFKGSYINELWQVAVKLSDGILDVPPGLGTQSILWSDPAVFFSYSQAAGNSIMFLLTEYALKEALNTNYRTPLELLDHLLPLTLEYGRKLTGLSSLKTTFALNALVAVDNAAWLLYAYENNTLDFYDIVPAYIKKAFTCRHEELAAIPLITYGMSTELIRSLANAGHFLLKIKIGSDPDRDGDMDKMAAWDMERLSAIHDAVKDIYCGYTHNSHILYYLDANGRYDSKERLLKFIEHASHIDALDRILLLEEPFAEENKIDVSDIPVMIAADESAHSEKDVIERIDLGYGAIALKPIAKTLSMSLKILDAAYKKNIPCFCADLTVNPILADWNKNFAARLMPLPGIKIGLIETNGAQNYKQWNEMQHWHPCFGSDWLDPVNGVYNLDDNFYNKSGGIFMFSKHYASLV